MRRIPRVVLLAGLVVLAPALSGCANFDLDKLDVFGLSDKKKLPGDRKPVFPEGVPGVSQGVPPEYIKGNQPPPETAQTLPAEPANTSANTSAKSAAVAPGEEPKPEAKTESKPTPRKPRVSKKSLIPATGKPPTSAQPASAQPAPWPTQSQAPAQKQATQPWPGSDQQSAGGNGTAPWPAAPPSGTFSR